MGVRVVSSVESKVGPPSTVGTSTSKSRSAVAGMYMWRSGRCRRRVVMNGSRPI